LRFGNHGTAIGGDPEKSRQGLVDRGYQGFLAMLMVRRTKVGPVSRPSLCLLAEP
jgi:hypothetical protein